MVQSITDLYTGALETTATTLHWALLYMVAYPDVQDKVRKELEDVLGSSQTISYEDRERLPFTNAVLHEIQRLSKVIITSFRCCTRDTELHGFPIKKGAMTLFNIGSVLCDPKQWKNPQQFDPTNFLDDSGKFMNREAFLPFAAGVRVCLGEKLARTELFIFFVSLMRTFTFRLPEGVERINTQPILGRIRSHPQSYRLCAVPC
ncbi:cytochrome P450 2J5-like [Sceloporus undulatus]|uniref:cytochrome P450 2J5-like n=1 Tax=Sceloporus undulatus TaxID=8520 RepID=UPI001C4D2692|nr:cytochrome P450 2J5-like [Sceloporus undulatus]